MEKIVRVLQHELKSKKYENEWNRLTTVDDVKSVMERGSHFEDIIDPDKFARVKSTLPTSPPMHEKFKQEKEFPYDFNPNHFYVSQRQSHF